MPVQQEIHTRWTSCAPPFDEGNRYISKICCDLGVLWGTWQIEVFEFNSWISPTNCRWVAVRSRWQLNGFRTSDTIVRNNWKVRLLWLHFRTTHYKGPSFETFEGRTSQTKIFAGPSRLAWTHWSVRCQLYWGVEQAITKMELFRRQAEHNFAGTSMLRPKLLNHSNVTISWSI